MKKLFLLSFILIACEATPPPPKTSKDAMVDKAWETDAIWADICKREKAPMCYGALHHPNK